MKKILKRISNFLPDNLFVRIQYLYFTGKILHLKKPKGFNEKLQWLKVYDRNPIYTMIVDKFAVRDYVEQIIGKEYLIPLVNVYDSTDDIKWDDLPKSFVLKCTHGSGCNIICSNKQDMSIKKAYENLDIWMNTNFYYVSREWPYKNVKPKIICEQFLEDDIYDYKFYCFDGEPKFLYVSQGEKSDKRMNFYDLDWNRCEFYREDHKDLYSEHSKPENFDEMLDITRKLCKEFPFVRVDLFNVAGKLYFGELTLTPGGGLSPFSPDKWEKVIGNWINIKNKEMVK